ncbi:MAG: hypothetical protein WCD70_11735 [Alphaproteobacteria bacterium]
MPHSPEWHDQSTSTVTHGDRDSSAVISWSAILGGAVAGLALSFVLLALGTGFGLASVSPLWHERMVSSHFSYLVAIWLIITQWLSSGLAGYITGRLRTKWNGVHTHEIFFRDTAHGFLAWAVATVLYTALILLTATSAFSDSMHAAGSAGMESNAPDAYYIDSLFRADGSGPAVDPETRGEATRIMLKGVKDGSLSRADETYLAQLIGTHTGMASADAESRIDDALAQIRKSIDSTRKVAAIISIFTGLSMLIGAFIACVTAALGGSQRDEPYPVPQ